MSKTDKPVEDRKAKDNRIKQLVLTTFEQLANNSPELTTTEDVLALATMTVAVGVTSYVGASLSAAGLFDTRYAVLHGGSGLNGLVHLALKAVRDELDTRMGLIDPGIPKDHTERN